MNYKEKYNEALERARALRQEAIDKEYAIDYVKDYEAIFPELAESDDERMIERIELSLHSLKQWINGCDEMQPSRKEECITEIKEQEAWLKKQKEQKSADLSEMMVHKEPYIAPVPTPMVADEQKPYEPKNWPADKDSLTQEQKPAEWSEEDEEMLKCVIMDVESAKEDYLKSTTEVVRQGAILADKELAWLKSLPLKLKKENEEWRHYIWATNLRTTQETPELKK